MLRPGLGLNPFPENQLFNDSTFPGFRPLAGRLRILGPPAADRRSAGLQRARHYGEVNHGLADPGEAARCFSCGDCTGCDICLVYCPDGIIHRTGLAADSGAAYVVDADYCKGCGICAAECPRGALIMVAS